MSMGEGDDVDGVIAMRMMSVMNGDEDGEYG